MKTFQIYKSSAGSGKTYTLVKAYLGIVLRNPDKVRHILAITFTNAAATEMKTRIIRELERLRSLPENPSDEKTKKLLSEIRQGWQEAYGASLSEEKTFAHADVVLSTILHKYADFSVSTIDSFAHRLIRSFAFDLYLPFHFDVELDADALISQAADILISRAGTDEALTKLLISFILGQADEEKNLQVAEMITDMGKTLLEEDGFLALEKLEGLSLADYLEAADRLTKHVREYEETVHTVSKKALALVASKGLTAAQFFRGSTGIIGYFEKISRLPAGPVPAPNSYVRDTIDSQKWFSPKASGAEKQAVTDISGDLEKAFMQITGPNDVLLKTYKLYRELRRHIFPVAVLNELDTILQDIRDEHMLLHISDFNKKIASVIAEQPVPFIYERLGELYHHYMIDEFQDTSALQWYNMLPLFDNALASGHINLVVGDGKQAIYRFRNGDVEQFAALPRLSASLREMARPEWENTLTSHAETKPLNNNFRSLQEIVWFNNAFFAYAAGTLSEDLREIYAGVKQQALDSKQGGYVEVRFLDADTRNPGHEDVSYADVPDETSSQTRPNDMPAWQHANLEHTLQIIRELQDLGHPISDIAILCRTRREASLVSRTLLQHNIPVISAESLQINQSDDVNFIISLIRLTDNPANQVAAVEVITYLYKNSMVRKPETLHACLNILQPLKNSPRSRHTRASDAIEHLLQENGITLSFDEFRHQNVYDIIETIISKFFSMHNPPNAFVAFFSDALFDYAEKNNLTTTDFLSWWDVNGHKFSLIAPPGICAIQVLTIHKSKGLQYPVVIMPFTDHKLSTTTKPGSWVDLELEAFPKLKASWVSLSGSALKNTPFEPLHTRELEKSCLDTLNMIYVACTRAENKLFILTKKSKTYKNNTAQGLMHGFLASSGRWDDNVQTYSFGTCAPHAGATPGSGVASEETLLTKSSSSGRQEEDFGQAKPGFHVILSQPWNRALKVKSHQAATNTEASSYGFLERGNLLHRAMERIVSMKDVDAVLEQMLLDGEIHSERKQAWTRKIKSILSHPKISPYFAEHIPVKSEAGIFDSQGNYFRPDRVVFLDNETAVLDYKSGQQYPAHKAQIASYASLLRQMGYPKVTSYLLYLDTGEVVCC